MSRVKEVWYCAEEDRPIARSEMIKGYETSKDNYVAVEDEELKKIAPATATTMEILQFVGSDEVDPIFFQTSYYVTPEDKTTKPYALFVAALADTRQDAIAKVAMHNREHIVLMRPYGSGGMVLHTLYYPDELNKSHQTEVPKAKYSAKELELARSLVAQMRAPFEPDQFKDAYRENVEQLIEQKQKGQHVSTVAQPHKAPVIDLLEALKRSLQQGPKRKSAPQGGAAKKAAKRRKAA
jgi:DNA end-binding protein Ku